MGGYFYGLVGGGGWAGMGRGTFWVCGGVWTLIMGGCGWVGVGGGIF